MLRRLKTLVRRTGRQAPAENAGQRALEAQQARQALARHRRTGRDSRYAQDGPGVEGTDW